MKIVWSKEVFAKNLKYYMELNRKTQSDIISDLGFKQSTFNEWVNAKKYPRIDKIEILANYFGILKSDWIEEKEKKPTTTSELSESKKKIIDLLLTVPDEKIDYVVRILSTILEVEE